MKYSDYDFIFCLGDSRTGTSSFHLFFESMGYKCIHHYENLFECAGLSAESFSKKKSEIIEFIGCSGIRVFSDYPTRLLYEDLYEHYPNSLFVLTQRSSFDSWATSMRNYFGGTYVDNEAKLNANYLNNNRKILNFFYEKENFFNLIVDDPDSVAIFLAKYQFPAGITFPHVNRAEDVIK